MVKAAEKFDETRGFKFISYAVWWIRQSILQAIAEQSRIVRLPLNQVGAISKINQVTNEFVQKHNRRPSIHELAELTGIDEARIRQSQSADNHHMSIDAPFSDDDDNSMSDMLSSGDDSRTDRGVDFESMSDDLRAVLAKRRVWRRLEQRWVLPVNVFARFVRRLSRRFVRAAMRAYS